MLRLSLPESTSEQPAFSPETARQVRRLLPQIDEQTVGLTGLASPQETGQQWLSWFVGLAPAMAAPLPQSVPQILPFDPTTAGPAPTPAPPLELAPARYAVVAVVVTDQPDEGLARRVAGGPLNALLTAE